MRSPALLCLLLIASSALAGEPTASRSGAPAPASSVAPAPSSSNEPPKAAEQHYDGGIVLAGAPTAVRWVDGDSFEFLSGPRKGKETRLIGYNTLESYGPAHRWGEWTARELWGLSKLAPKFAAKHEWACSTQGKKDGYGRLLVDCPDLRTQMVKKGYGHVFAYDEPADPALLELQREARLASRGMWAKGLAEEVVTSVHNGTASRSGGMRVVDSRTGETRMVGHEIDLKTCQEICHGDKWRGSCMIFVPYELRYGPKRAECLQGEPPEWPPKDAGEGAPTNGAPTDGAPTRSEAPALGAAPPERGSAPVAD